MSQHNDLLYLDDMADHARRALRIAQKLGTYESFKADEFLQPGLIRELEVMGEASTKVSDQFREAHLAVAADARYAEPADPWLCKRQSACCLGHGSRRPTRST